MSGIPVCPTCILHYIHCWPGLLLIWPWILLMLLLIGSWPWLTPDHVSTWCFCTFVACSLLTLAAPLTILLSPVWLQVLPESLPWLSLILAAIVAVCPCFKPAGSSDKPSIQNLQFLQSSCIVSVPDLMPCQTSESTSLAATYVPPVHWHLLFHLQWGLGWRCQRCQLRQFSLLPGTWHYISIVLSSWP